MICYKITRQPIFPITAVNTHMFIIKFVFIYENGRENQSRGYYLIARVSKENANSR